MKKNVEMMLSRKVIISILILIGIIFVLLTVNQLYWIFIDFRATSFWDNFIVVIYLGIFGVCFGLADDIWNKEKKRLGDKSSEKIDYVDKRKKIRIVGFFSSVMLIIIGLIILATLGFRDETLMDRYYHYSGISIIVIGVLIGLINWGISYLFRRK